MAGHKHDTNGAQEDSEIRVGPEYITYRKKWCTCGYGPTEQTVIGRRPA